MPLPNLIGIGAQRAATTWMHHCLGEHPEIFVPEKKEVHFFDQNFEKGVEWYETHFEAATENVVAEVTPNYINADFALERIASVLPDAKLFVVLREPISRAYSSYRLLYNEHYRGMSFEQACESSPYLLRLSSYSEDMKRAFSLFGRSNVAVFLYDDVQSDPANVLRQMYDFAAVDSSFVPDSVNVRYNPVIWPSAQDFLEKVQLGNVLEAFKKSHLGLRLKNRLSARKQRHEHKDKAYKSAKKVASDAYIATLNRTFRDDILETQVLIGKDLSSWLE